MVRRFTAWVIGLTLMLPMAGAASAAPTTRPHIRIGAQSTYSECYCRANGTRYEVGESVCINSGSGPRLATCAMQQNVTSWDFKQTCPES